MNIKKNRLGLMALVISSVMVLSACNGTGGNANYTEEQMEEKIVAAFEAMEDVDSARSNISIVGTAGVDGEEASFDLEMGIAQEILDKEAMEYNIDFSLAGDVSFEDTNVGFSLAVIALQDAVYANLGDITGLEDDPNVAMFLPMIQGYMNQWWKFELPEGGLNSLGVPEDADIAAQQEELLALLKDAELFESIEFAGRDKVGSNNVEKFEVKLSEEGVIEYLRQVVAMTDPGEEISDEEVAEVQEVLDTLNLETVVWITDDGYVGGMSIDVVGTIEDEFESVDLDVALVVEYTDFNENVKIEAPADSTLFDLGGLGLGAPAGFDPSAGYGEPLPY